MTSLIGDTPLLQCQTLRETSGAVVRLDHRGSIKRWPKPLQKLEEETEESSPAVHPHHVVSWSH